MSSRPERRKYLKTTIIPLLDEAMEKLNDRGHDANVDEDYTPALNVIPDGEEDAVGLLFWGAKGDAIRWMRTDENHIRVIDDFDPGIANGIVSEFVKTFA